MQLLAQQSKHFTLVPQNKIKKTCKFHPLRGYRSLGIQANQHHAHFKKREEAIAKIKEKFGKVELSVSSYDTAWVAMVPSRDNPNQPCFPQYLDWIMKNQHPNGSWGLHSNISSHHNPSQLKDSLSCTLACLLALQKWEVGQQLVQRGLDYIGISTQALGHDSLWCEPIGFDVVFPGMISLAKDQFNLTVPLNSSLLDYMFRNRDAEIQRRGSTLAYVAEGLGKSCDWKEVLMVHQRSNGSLFNSPATTAAALINFDDDNCFHYLHFLSKLHDYAVPTTYPHNVYTRLCLVDTLEKMGISRYFKYEIDTVLEETYRCWLQKDEEIWLDTCCCAMAFRLLRMNGYDVAVPDSLAEFVNQETFFATSSVQFTSINTILELYKASEVTIYEKEPILDGIHEWTRTFLQNSLLNQEIGDHRLHKEVDHTLEYSINSLDRLRHRRSIELYNKDKLRMLKTSYRCPNIDNEELLLLSQQDFNECQAIHHEELKQIEKWIKEKGVDALEFDWHTLVSSHLQIASVHFAPEQADVRITWTIGSFLGTIVDDFFDVDGSIDELHNIIELFTKWDEHAAVGYSSKRIEILFCAIYDSLNEHITKASIVQGRCVKRDILEMWKNVWEASLQELEEWVLEKRTPSLEEYLLNGIETNGHEIYFTIFFFLGPNVSRQILESEEYRSIFSLCGRLSRLFNDYASVERDKVQRRLNSCLLLKEERRLSSIEEAREEVKKMIETYRREELRIMLQAQSKNKGGSSSSLVPKEVKESVYNLYKITHYLYTKGDGYRLPENNAFADIQALFYDPIVLPAEKS